MKRFSIAFAASLMLAALVAANFAVARPQQTIAHTTLKVGDMAPDFTLPDNSFKPVKLSDFRGKKNVILAFYVLAFTGG